MGNFCAPERIKKKKGNPMMNTQPSRQYSVVPGMCLVLFFCCIAFPSFAADSAHSEPTTAQVVGLAKLPATEQTVKELATKFEMYTKEYQRRLGLTRSKAVESTDAEEVKRIDQAMKGECVTDFTSRGAQDVRKFYDDKLVEITKNLIRELGNDTKKLLQDGKTEDAIYIKDTLSFLEQYIVAKPAESAGKKQYKFDVEADKDWQETGIMLKMGSVVWIEAQGKWAPGWPNNKNRPDLGDADTFRVQYRIQGNGENLHTGGVKYDFEAKNNGMLEVRMAVGRNSMRSEARGKLQLRFLVKEPTETSVVSSESLETVLRRLIKGEPSQTATKAAFGAKDATETKASILKVVVKPDSDWSGSGVNVKVGDKLKIEAIGEWTPNADKKPPMSADMYQYDARIGDNSLGKGGKMWEVVANRSGELQFRASFYGWAKKREFSPGGSMQLSITITPAAVASQP